MPKGARLVHAIGNENPLQILSDALTHFIHPHIEDKRAQNMTEKKKRMKLKERNHLSIEQRTLWQI